MPTPEINKENVLKALKELGDTPDKVAESLKTFKCVGETCDSKSCPIAKYLSYVFNVQVDVAISIFIETDTSKTFRLPYREIPSVINEFIKNFDYERYPELIVEKV